MQRKPLNLKIDTSFAFEYRPGDTFVMLWDRYGFFTHVYRESWEEEVMNRVRKETATEDLVRLGGEFMMKRQQLYCCLN